MSHFVNVKTQMKNLEALVSALARNGFSTSKVEVHDTPQNLYGYQGDVRAQKAHVIIRRRYIGSSSNDIGFENIDGTYVAHISEFDSGTGTYASNHSSARCNQEWQNKLGTYYGIEAAKLECKKNHMRCLEEVDKENRPTLRIFVEGDR